MASLQRSAKRAKGRTTTRVPTTLVDTNDAIPGTCRSRELIEAASKSRKNRE